MRRATHAEVCQWILQAWKKVKTSSIVNGFRKAEIIAADDAQPRAGTADEYTSGDSGDSSDNMAGMDSECGGLDDDAILNLFISDTEDEDFSGFSAEDETEED